MRLQIHKKIRRGSLLLFSLLFGLIIATMLLPTLQLQRQTTRIAFSTRASDHAFYAAESGIAKTLAFIASVGGGGLPGIHDDRFTVAESSAYYPFGTDWVTMADGAATEINPPIGARVRVWFNAAQGNWTIESVGRALLPKPTYRTVRVTLGAASFARFAFFNTASLSAIDGRARWLARNETFNGPVHSNRHLFVYGTYSPNQPLTFNSDVTLVASEVVSSNSNNRNIVYNGLKDTDAAYIELPSELTRLTEAAASGGLDLPGDDPWMATAPPEFAAGGDPNPSINNYRFVFNANGTVTYTNLDAVEFLVAQGTSRAAATGQAATTLAIAGTNGAMIVRDGNVLVSGTLDGEVTLAALASDAASGLVPPFADTRSDGNIIIEGNLIYESHPLVGGGFDLSDSRTFEEGVVDDMLGLIAERNIVIDGSMPATGIIDAHIMVTGQASPNPDVRDWGTGTGAVNAAIGQDGGFYIEDGIQRDLSELWTGIPDSEPGDGNRTGTWKSGNLYLTGGVVHFLRGQTGNGSGGFTRKYSFDSRLMTKQPPYYPLTPDITIVGWSDIASVEDPAASHSAGGGPDRGEDGAPSTGGGRQ